MAVMLRFVPTIQEEWQIVNQALRLRGMALTWKNILRRPVQMIEYMLVPFLLQCSVIVDEMTAAYKWSCSSFLCRKSGRKRTYRRGGYNTDIVAPDCWKCIPESPYSVLSFR